MSRELNFSLEVLENATYTPNAEQFFSKAYLGSDVVGNFRVLPGVKHSAKIAYTLFKSILKAQSCNFSSIDTALGSITVTVEGFSAMIELCQFEVEQSFAVQQIAAGANMMDAPAFLAHFWEQAALEIAEEIELMRWQGIKDGEDFDEEEDFLALVDGYEILLKNAITGVTATFTGGTGTAATVRVNVGRKGTILSVDVLTAGAYSVAPTGLTLANKGEGKGATFSIQTTGSSPTITVTGVTVLTGGTGYPTVVQHVTSTTLTQSNILTEMAKVFAKIPKRIRRRKDLLRWNMSPVAADFYRLATAAGNTQTFITKALDLTYLDIKIVVCDGISDDVMTISRWDNLGYAFDVASDGNSLKLVDLRESVAEPKLRARTEMKAGFFLLNNEEIVYYGQAA